MIINQCNLSNWNSLEQTKNSNEYIFLSITHTFLVFEKEPSFLRDQDSLLCCDLWDTFWNAAHCFVLLPCHVSPPDSSTAALITERFIFCHHTCQSVIPSTLRTFEPCFNIHSTFIQYSFIPFHFRSALTITINYLILQLSYPYDTF